jgi:hypothetical protein
MAWKLHAIEQTQLRRQHCVDGVGRLKFDSTQFRTKPRANTKTTTTNDGRLLRRIGSSGGGGGAGGGAPSTLKAAAASTLAFASLASNNLSRGSTASWWNSKRSRTSAESVASAYKARAASLLDSAWPRSSTRTSAANGGFSSPRQSRGSASARACVGNIALMAWKLDAIEQT